MDWNKEVTALKQANELEQREWFKPKPGKHKITILSNGEEYTTTWEDKEIKKVRFDIENEGKKYSWGVSKGMTENSLYGQIALIGKASGNLEGKDITLVVKGTGKEVSYTVLEALPLMQIKEEWIR